MSPIDRHVRRIGAFILESNLPKAWQELRTLHEIGCLRVLAVPLGVLAAALSPQVELTFSRAQALLSLWPTWLSYAVSYLFIAIVWTNHHYLMRYAKQATPRLLWINFAHLFSMSLLPLSTAWMAVSRLAPQPVAFYAAVFFLVNVTYRMYG
jgi:uncharacterized membrane protein